MQLIDQRAYSVDMSADGEWLAVGGYSTTASWVYHLDNSSYMLYQTFTHTSGNVEVELSDEALVVVLGVRGAMYEVYIFQNSTWELEDKFYGE